MSFPDRIRGFFARLGNYLSNPKEGKRYTLKGMESRHTCLNCGWEYEGRFCPRCGQKSSTAKLTPKNIINDALSVFSFERKSFLGTVIQLFYRPGHFIRDYLKGHRSPYYSPINFLFLLCVIFAIEMETGIIKIQDSKTKVKEAVKVALDEKPAATIDSAGWSWDWADEAEEDDDGLADVSFEDLEKDAVKSSAQEEIQVNFEEAKDSHISEKRTLIIRDLVLLLNYIDNWSRNNKALVIVLLNITLAFVCWLVFRRAPEVGKLSYTEHFFIQIFISCQFLIINIIVLPFYRTSDGSVSTLLLSLFMVWDFKQLYQISWIKSILKTLLVGILNILVGVLAFVIISFLIFLVLGIKNDALSLLF